MARPVKPCQLCTRPRPAGLRVSITPPFSGQQRKVPVCVPCSRGETEQARKAGIHGMDWRRGSGRVQRQLAKRFEEDR